MEAVAQLACDALTGYRLTRLVTEDVIADLPRDRLIAWSYRRRDGRLACLAWRKANPYETQSDRARHDPDAPKVATLVTCRWCAGVWITAGIVAARRRIPRVWQPVSEAGVIASACALIARLEA